MKINLPLGVATNSSACIMGSYLKKRGIDMTAKTFKVILHLQSNDENGTQFDRVTSYLAANLDQVDEMINLDNEDNLLYWELA
jgi:hypothetical protein